MTFGAPSDLSAPSRAGAERAPASLDWVRSLPTERAGGRQDGRVTGPPSAAEGVSVPGESDYQFPYHHKSEDSEHPAAQDPRKLVSCHM